MAEKTKKVKKQRKDRTAADSNRFPKIVKRRNQMPRGKHRGMELMLVEHVPSLGERGEIVEVKPGYGRNYLLPQGLATYVTPEAKIRIEKHNAKLEALRIARMADLKVMAKRLEKHSLTIEANANEEGHLYGSVTASDIAAGLLKDGFEVQDTQVRLEGPLKELALYEVKIVLDPEVETSCKIWVVPTSAKS